MPRRLSRAPLVAALVAALAGAAAAQTTLSLPIPERETLPREKITLSIKIPEKVEAIAQPPPARPRLRSETVEAYDFNLSGRHVPRLRFVNETLERLDRIGIKPGRTARTFVWARSKDRWAWGRIIHAYYKTLKEIFQKDALTRFEITPLDIERFRQVVDIFSRELEVERYSPIEMDRTLVEMIDFLKRIRGQGTIKVVQLKEASDGSMTLELEVRKEPRLTRHGTVLTARR